MRINRNSLLSSVSTRTILVITLVPTVLALMAVGPAFTSPAHADGIPEWITTGCGKWTATKAGGTGAVIGPPPDPVGPDTLINTRLYFASPMRTR